MLIFSENTLTKISRVIFDLISGHLGSTKLTHQITITWPTPLWALRSQRWPKSRQTTGVQIVKMVGNIEASCWMEWTGEGRHLLEMSKRKEPVVRTLTWQVLQAEARTSAKPRELQRIRWDWENHRRPGRGAGTQKTRGRRTRDDIRGREADPNH